MRALYQRLLFCWLVWLSWLLLARNAGTQWARGEKEKGRQPLKMSCIGCQRKVFNGLVPWPWQRNSKQCCPPSYQQVSEGVYSSGIIIRWRGGRFSALRLGKGRRPVKYSMDGRRGTTACIKGVYDSELIPVAQKGSCLTVHPIAIIAGPQRDTMSPTTHRSAFRGPKPKRECIIFGSRMASVRASAVDTGSKPQ